MPLEVSGSRLPLLVSSPRYREPWRLWGMLFPLHPCFRQAIQKNQKLGTYVLHEVSLSDKLYYVRVRFYQREKNKIAPTPQDNIKRFLQETPS